MRIGHGYDIHRLVPGRRLVLGGVIIPHSKGLLGHSDADVLIHAIIDAIIGALGQGDIGAKFPDNDDSYKDINSVLLLEATLRLMRKAGYKIVNIDSTVIAQEPKLSPHIFNIRDRLSEIIGIPSSLINVKAKTEEGLGYVGSGDAMVAHAVVLLEENAVI